MKLKLKTITAVVCLLGCFRPLWASSPWDEVDPRNPLYQRVKHLEVYGLLDPVDQQVLDEGKYVTRMELAFYTEKAKARLTAPDEPQVTPTSPVSAPPAEAPGLPPAEAPAVPPAVGSPSNPSPVSSPVPAPSTGVPALPPPATEAPALPPSATTMPPTGASKEIDDLLKQMHEEAVMLRTRLTQYDTRIHDQEDELDKLKGVQDEVDSVWKKANKSVGMPHFYYNTQNRFESFNVSGPVNSSTGTDLNNVMRVIQQVDFGLYTDLGGKGSLSTGFGAFVPYSNASGVYATGVGPGPVSIYIANPSVTYDLYGDLGKWDTTFCVEAYQPDTTLGNFSRGFATYAIKRFEDPFAIKNFTDDRNAKNWDDYMTSISNVPAYSPTAGNVQSASDRVFDGIYAVGKQVPWLGPDGKMTLLVGRMGTSPTQTQRWEQAAKIDEPWGADKVFRTALSIQWVNDDFGVNQPVQLDLKDYDGDVKLNLDPVFLELEGALCDFSTGGTWSGPSFTSFNNPSTGANYSFQPSNQGLEDKAAQASLIFYPLTFYYFGIGSEYADFQSRVMMSGLNFFHYGLTWNPSDFNDAYGAVAEADTLQSNRYGWRLNFGWNGRKQAFMKDWPSCLDSIVINLDLTQKNEYSAEFSPLGYNVIEPFTMLRFYYPDDEGLWGLDLWGNYAPNVNPLRLDSINNIQAVRNDTDISNDDIRYQFRLSSERLPLILPIYNNGGTLSLTPAAPGQAIDTYTLNGTKYNHYANLTDLKTYHYVTFTTKLQMHKWFGLKSPIDATLYYTDNVVGGVASNAATNLNALPPGSTDVNGNPNGSSFSANIPNLFEQVVWDADFMINVLSDVDLMADFGEETWKSGYTYPLVDYDTKAFGLGLAYDIPWCGGKWEFRYKRIDFNDKYVAANNYGGDQFFSRLKFLF